MTQEEKDLVLRDLCARLPYPPICHIVGENGAEIDDILTTSTIQNLDVWVVKPYLRPMSSMTNKEYEHTKNMSPLDYINWLNAHHFDYCGLIEKSHALSTKEFNPYKERLRL